MRDPFFTPEHLDRTGLQDMALAHDIRSAQEFCNRNEMELRVRSSKRRTTMRITIHRPCPTVNRAGQIELASRIVLDVRLGPRYPRKPPEVTVPGGTPHPFHPHFSVASLDFPGAEQIGRLRLTTPRWYDYKVRPTGETLGEFLYRICQSLSFHPEYIEAEHIRVANRQAALWYEELRRHGGMRFPIAPPARAPEPSRRRFQIHEVTPSQEPQLAARPRGDTILATSPREPTRQEPALHIRAPAMDQIFQHVGWGRRTATNANEQGGILVGRILRDTATNEPYTVVDHAVPAESADGSAAYLSMDHATWGRMLDGIDLLRGEGALAPNARIVGWYHTHPNELSVFMSGTDRRTQQTFFADPSNVALVLNPHKQIWRAFFGADCTERLAVVYRTVESDER